MTKYEFLQIVERNKLARIRDNGIGFEWLKPILLLEAESDRHELIEFCLSLGHTIKVLRKEKDHG